MLNAGNSRNRSQDEAVSGPQCRQVNLCATAGYILRSSPPHEPEATGWSIKKSVRTTRRYSTIEIQAGARTITAADSLPGDLRQALDRAHRDPGAH